jgi:hypothetical protein
MFEEDLDQGLPQIQLAVNQVLANYTDEDWTLEQVVQHRTDTSIEFALYWVKDD